MSPSGLFAAKVMLHRGRRAAVNAVAGPRLLAHGHGTAAPCIAESRTPLWSDPAPGEAALQLGKVHNLRVACRALDGLVMPAGVTFSVWRHLGPPIRARGYVPGRMLQQGCMVPAIGGGLCQLSNALYDVALQAGCRIVERHAHSRTVPGSAAAAGRDATIAWNYVDLRFAHTQTLHLTARLERETLVVRLHGGRAPVAGAAPGPIPPAARSCASCDETRCIRHEAPASPPATRHVFLVDEAWPELLAYVAGRRTADDVLGLPLAGTRVGRYAWPTAGFAHAAAAPLATLRRSLALRRTGPQGGARRRADLAATGRLALSLARVLGPGVTECTVAQSYLPHLWRAGHLGGRRFTVLMTRLPAAILHARLDSAARPDCPTLADYRAPDWVVAAEAEALAAADAVVTPHAAIAALFGPRAVRLRWHRPSPMPSPDAGSRIGFPGPTLARKGAHTVRDAAAALGLGVVPAGPELEGPAFWRGLDTTAGPVAAMVQPAIIEDQPRRLLAALAAGIPVIATAACGLDPQPGLVIIPADDVPALVAALRGITGPAGVGQHGATHPGPSSATGYTAPAGSRSPPASPAIACPSCR